LNEPNKWAKCWFLHVDKTPDGKPMTMQNMNAMQAKSGRNERLLCDTDWYKDEDFYTQDAPRLSWRLVSKSVLPDSTSKDEVEQMELIVKTLQNGVFEGMEMPAEYQEAVDEFEAKKTEIKDSEMIENLQLCKLTRATPAEMIQAIEMHYQNTGEYLFSDSYVRTRLRNSSGDLVSVGDADADGVVVDDAHPGIRFSDIGATLSLQS